ncbi:MAG: DNA polymerase III subunit alpha, partial [Candidatus Woesearchaeota archaeon]
MVNPFLVEISKRLNIPTILTNDDHYLNKEDAKAQDIFLCIQNKTTIYDENRMKMDSEEFYLKSPQEMFKAYKNVNEKVLKQSIINSNRLAEKCNVKLDTETFHIPKFKFDESKFKSDTALLAYYANEGAKKKLNKITPEIRERAKEELNIIKNMGYSSYFLIVKDFIDYARKNGIKVGPGRGSAAG